MTAQIPAKPGQRPTSFLSPIQREFDRLFDQLGAGLAPWSDLDAAPRMDVRDTAEGVEITAELPGIEEQDVRVSLSDNMLTISGEKTVEKATNQKDYRLSERSYGAFSRSVVLPAGVEPDKITATMRNGVLRLFAPRPASAQPKTIPIETKAN